MKAADPDLIDNLLQEWQHARPDLDASAMAVVGRLIRAGSQLRDSAAQALKSFDLLYTDFDILATLRRSPAPHRLTPSQLGDAVLLTSGAMTAALKRLEEKALITRAGAASDGRVRTVELTAAGAQLAEEAAATRFEEAQTRVAALTETEQDQLAGLLRKLLLEWDS